MLIILSHVQKISALLIIKFTHSMFFKSFENGPWIFMNVNIELPELLSKFSEFKEMSFNIIN